MLVKSHVLNLRVALDFLQIIILFVFNHVEIMEKFRYKMAKQLNNVNRIAQK